MDLGTGIFLSALFLGTVALYIATKDRWNWKKVLLWPLLIFVALGVLAGGGFFIYQSWEGRPKPQQELWGIRLGENMADVKFSKGAPAKQSADTWFYEPEAGKPDKGLYVVRFKNGKVRFVMYDGPRLYAPTIQGISGYSSPDHITAKYGLPSSVSRSKDELTRILSFDAFNVAFTVARNEVTALGIYNASEGPLRFSEGQ